jgi:aminoglycoside phosphotransferase (APT) family kinase protein
MLMQARVFPRRRQRRARPLYSYSVSYALLAASFWRPRRATAHAWLRAQFGPGDRMLHLGLHPGNVMLTAAGPVVTDWSNAAAGAPAADVAMAWPIIATSEADAPPPLLLRPAISSIRAVLLRRFRALARDDPGPQMARVAPARIADRNTRPAQAQRLQAIADLAGRPAPAS